MTSLYIQLLGDFLIRSDQGTIQEVFKQRFMSLLTYLLVNRKTSQPRSKLAYIFWPDSSEKQARTNLRNLIHLLRCSLPNFDDFISIDNYSIQWCLDSDFHLDLDSFERSVDQMEKDGENSIFHAEEAVMIYQGDLSPYCYDDWIIPVRERLRQKYSSILGRLGQYFEKAQDYEKAIFYLEKLRRHDPSHEPTYHKLINLHTVDRNYNEAIRVYLSCVSFFRSELATEPTIELQNLYEQLQRRKAGNKNVSAATPTSIVSVPFIGRAEEIALIKKIWAALLNEKIRFVLVKGEGGAGKTRFLEELYHWSNECRLKCVLTQCFTSKTYLSYFPIISWLRGLPLTRLEEMWRKEIAVFLPELYQETDIQEYQFVNQITMRQRFFEAFKHAILGVGQPLLLFVDDLQWCDSESLECLKFLLQFAPNASYLIIGTFRSEELIDNPFLTDFLSFLYHHKQVVEIELDGLDEIETISLGIHLTGGKLKHEALLKLYSITEGNPAFILEYLRDRLILDEQVTNSRGAQDFAVSYNASIPTQVKKIISERLGHLSAPARRLVDLAAVIEKDFSLDFLRKFSNLDEEMLVDSIDELCQRKIFQIDEEGRLGFTHQIIGYGAASIMSKLRGEMLERRLLSLVPDNGVEIASVMIHI